MENDYKSIAQAQSLCEAVSGIPRLLMNDHGNPLDPKLNDRPRPTFEMMNRDTGKVILSAKNPWNADMSTEKKNSYCCSK